MISSMRYGHLCRSRIYYRALANIGLIGKCFLCRSNGPSAALAHRRANSKAIFRISTFAVAVSARQQFASVGAIDETQADFEAAFVST